MSAEQALKSLLAQTVGAAATTPVFEAMKQSMRIALPNGGFPSTWFNGTWSTRLFGAQQQTSLSQQVPTLTDSSAYIAPYMNAVVCEQLYLQTNAASLIDESKVTPGVQGWSAQIISQVGSIGVLAVSQDANVASLAKAAVAAGATLAAYAEAVVAILPSRILLYNNGNWTNGHLEIFDWLGKYVAMGGTLATVPTFFAQLDAAQLPAFPNLTAAAFPKYNGYFTKTAGPVYSDFPEDLPFLKSYMFLPVPNPFPPTWAEQYMRWATDAQPYRAPSSCCSADTEVLLADGSAKLITAVTADDMLLGRDGPVAPLFVSEVPRAGRDLHELFEGAGPRLTSGHPIVNAGEAAEDATTLAIHATSLRGILPNHRRTGVATIEPGTSTVSVRSTTDDVASAAEVRTVEMVRSTDTDADGDSVFDVVLPFDTTKRQGYWAGRNGTFVLIEPEIARLGDDPLTAVALFEAIAGIALSGALTPAGGLTQTMMRSYFDEYGLQITSRALRIAMAEAEPAEPPGYGSGDVGAAIDAFVRDSRTGDESSVEVLGVLLEVLTRDLYVSLSNTIRTGWRSMPQPDLREWNAGTPPAGRGDILAVTLFDLEMLHTDLGVGAHSQLEVAITGSGQTTTSVLDADAGSPLPFHAVFDGTLSHRLRGDEAPDIALSLRTGSHRPAHAASGPTVLPLDTYAPVRVALFDATGRHVAWVNGDVRRLRRNHVQIDQAPTAWSDDQRFAHAVGLGRALVAPLVEGLEARESAMERRPISFLQPHVEPATP